MISSPASILFTVDDNSVKVPVRGSAGAAGFDLCAHTPHALYLFPGQSMLVPTGLRVAIPPDHELQVRPRSGIALRHNIILPNAPGTIDSDYRGELRVLIRNIGESIFVIRSGDRIAQVVCVQLPSIRWERCATLPDSVRGTGGFGSTGRR